MVFTPKKSQILFGAETRSCTQITCFSDTRLHYVGHLGVDDGGLEPPTFSARQTGLVDPRGFEPLTFRM